MRALFLTRPRNVGSALIRAREGSTASHCAVALADGTVVESVFPRVRSHTAEEWAAHCIAKGIKVVDDITLHMPDEDAAENYALHSVGRPYGVLGLLGYLLWRDLEIPRAPYCSQHLRQTLAAGGAYTLRDPALKRWGIATGREVCGLLAR